jgi:hypothetical protein
VRGSDNPVTDNSKITIKLTPNIATGEYVDTSDPLKNLPEHATKVTGSPVETYTLTVLYEPDYDIVSEGQGGSSVDDFHVGSHGTCYQGHAAGTENSINTFRSSNRNQNFVLWVVVKVVSLHVFGDFFTKLNQAPV